MSGFSDFSGRDREGPVLFFGPSVQEAAQKDNLAEVVSVVVDEEDGFVGQGLIMGVRDGSENVSLFEGGDEFLAVGAESGDGFVPSFRVGRFGGFGPVAIGEVGRFVLGVERIFDDVPLSETKVLEELIGGVGEAVGALATKLGGEIFDGGVEAGVGVAFGEMGEQFLAESVGFFLGLLLLWHGGCPPGGD